MGPSMFAVACSALAAARAPSDPTPVSCSIDGLADYSRTLPFCDLMKQARSFGSAKSPYDKNCTVGADGWPTQDSFGLIFITEVRTDTQIRECVITPFTSILGLNTWGESCAHLYGG